MENRYTYEKPADEKLYEEMRRKSLQGEPVKRTRKKVRINKKKMIRNLAALLTVTVGITLAGNHVVGNMNEAIQENALYGELFEEYLDEVFYPSMHHVDGTVSDYYLDYDMLGDYIDNSSDKDLALALTQTAIESKNLSDDENQMNKIIAETNLNVESYDEYLSKNYTGYEDKEKFVKDTKHRLMEEAKSSELASMQEEKTETLEEGEKSL